MEAISEYCVVLNNQHQIRIDEFNEMAQVDPKRIVLFQPYTDNHLRQVFATLQKQAPLPLFLVSGNYGDEIVAVSLLHRLEYTDEMTEERKAELLPSVSQHDSGGLYAVNVLSASNVRKLSTPLPVKNFLKVSDNTPLQPGRWPAVVCHTPSLVAVLEAF